MLGVLAFLGILGVSGMKAAYDNYSMKKSSAHYDEKGNLHYYDRLCRDYINNEKVEEVTRYDSYGNRHCYTVGTQSKKIYNDSFDQTLQRMQKQDEANLEKAKRRGNLAYNKYDPRFHMGVTTEIATGKIITCLSKTWNDIEKRYIYRKFYLKNPCPKRWEYNKTSNGDHGIDITEEEYKKLEIACGTFACLPSDSDVLNEIMGMNCFK